MPQQIEAMSDSIASDRGQQRRRLALCPPSRRRRPKRKRPKTGFDPDRGRFPTVDPVDYPRHNPWDGEFLSDETLTAMLWFHWGRRPFPSEVDEYRRHRGLMRWYFIRYRNIPCPWAGITAGTDAGRDGGARPPAALPPLRRRCMTRGTYCPRTRVAHED